MCVSKGKGRGGKVRGRGGAGTWYVRGILWVGTYDTHVDPASNEFIVSGPGFIGPAVLDSCSDIAVQGGEVFAVLSVALGFDGGEAEETVECWHWCCGFYCCVKAVYWGPGCEVVCVFGG